jgi:hypothetical protein
MRVTNCPKDTKDKEETCRVSGMVVRLAAGKACKRN